MRQLQVPSLIEPSLWERAGWMSVAYMAPTERAPILALVFHERDAAASIFMGWQRALGEVDADELLRIAIIEGDMAGHPPGYTVHIGLDAASVTEAATRLGIEVSSRDLEGADAWRRMPNPESVHLRRFKAECARHGRYLLVPATFEVGLELMPHLAIGKRRLAFRRVSDVGLIADPDAGLWGPTRASG